MPFAPRTYPVDEAAYSKSRPGEVTVGRRLLHRILPDLLFRFTRELEIWQTLLIRSVGEFAENEAFHADPFGGIDHGHLVHDALHADSANNGILAVKGLLEGGDGVVRPDGFDTIWKLGLRGGPGEDCHGEIGGDQRFDDVFS